MTTKKIYTKTGDRGMTGTLRGRVSKSDCQTEVLGAIDELNSWIGVCRANITNNANITKQLHRIQNNLLTIGSGMAGSELRIGSGEVRRLEKLIDRLTKDLPKLSNFIYLTGKGGAAELQVARAVARRAEREAVKLSLSQSLSLRSTLKYLNRLSDALFTMARWVNLKNKGEEEVWKIKKIDCQ